MDESEDVFIRPGSSSLTAYFVTAKLDISLKFSEPTMQNSRSDARPAPEPKQVARRMVEADVEPLVKHSSEIDLPCSQSFVRCLCRKQQPELGRSHRCMGSPTSNGSRLQVANKQTAKTLADSRQVRGCIGSIPDAWAFRDVRPPAIVQHVWWEWLDYTDLGSMALTATAQRVKRRPQVRLAPPHISATSSSAGPLLRRLPLSRHCLRPETSLQSIRATPRCSSNRSRLQVATRHTAKTFADSPPSQVHGCTGSITDAWESRDARSRAIAWHVWWGLPDYSDWLSMALRAKVQRAKRRPQVLLALPRIFATNSSAEPLLRRLPLSRFCLRSEAPLLGSLYPKNFAKLRTLPRPHSGLARLESFQSSRQVWHLRGILCKPLVGNDRESKAIFLQGLRPFSGCFQLRRAATPEHTAKTLMDSPPSQVRDCFSSTSDDWESRDVRSRAIALRVRWEWLDYSDVLSMALTARAQRVKRRPLAPPSVFAANSSAGLCLRSETRLQPIRETPHWASNRSRLQVSTRHTAKTLADSPPSQVHGCTGSISEAWESRDVRSRAIAWHVWWEWPDYSDLGRMALTATAQRVKRRPQVRLAPPRIFAIFATSSSAGPLLRRLPLSRHCLRSETSLQSIHGRPLLGYIFAMSSSAGSKLIFLQGLRPFSGCLKLGRAATPEPCEVVLAMHGLLDLRTVLGPLCHVLHSPTPSCLQGMRVRTAAAQSLCRPQLPWLSGDASPQDAPILHDRLNSLFAGGAA